MKAIAKLLFFGCLALVLTACFSTEVFPPEPTIEFIDISFVDTDGLDSLIVSFRFEDGDGNIGLTNSIADLDPPYHIQNFVVDDEDSVVTLGENDAVLPFYSAPVITEEIGGISFFRVLTGQKVLLSETDNRPPYNCNDYFLNGSDTIFITENEFYHNFHVEFQEKINGNYSPIDFQQIFGDQNCVQGDFNGRIPWFDPNGKEGEISYAMLSQAYRLAFQEDTIRLQFYLYDRDLNRSNIEVSRDFVLRDLL